MKKGILFLMLALAAGLAAFYITRSHRLSTHHEVLLDALPEMAWLRTELNLTDDQFAKASALHVAYRPICAEMCNSIGQAHVKLDSLARGGRGMTPELTAAIAHHAGVHAECQQKMLAHLYQTADLMDDQQAVRYLETMIPHALDSNLTGSAENCH